MKPFRDKNGQFCSQKKYERTAVEQAITEWGSGIDPEPTTPIRKLINLLPTTIRRYIS